MFLCCKTEKKKCKCVFAFYSQFRLGPHWWWLFAGRRFISVFLGADSGTALLFLLLLILGQPEVHPQAGPRAGAGVSVVCQGPCFQAGVGRGVREGHHHHGGAPILMVCRRCRLLEFGVCAWRPRHQPCRGLAHGQRVEGHRACFTLERG